MRITEFMYGGANGEFVEFTNMGTTAVNMSGWSYSDDNRIAGTVSLSAFGTVQPGESVILTETAAATFRTAWGLCSGVKVIGGNGTSNLGRADEINLYNGATNVDRLTYNDQGSGTVKSPRANNVSVFTTVGNLGANNASLWVLSATGDSEGSVSSTGGDKGSPGKTNMSATTTAFNPCAPPSNLTITVNNAATSDYMDGGATNAANSISFSGVLNDPLDPGATQGFSLDVKDNNVAIPNTAYTLTASSNNTVVVPNANVQIAKADGTSLITVTPAGVGYATITLTLTKSATTTTFTIDYAASAAASNPAQSVFHSGYSDGSAAVVIDNDFMVIADDEKNLLNVYARNQSGLPVKAFDYSAIADLALTDVSGGVPREIDLEAAAKSLSASTPNRSYWMGSLSNQSSAGSSFNDRPNRNRIFAVDITNTGAATAVSYVGSYKGLKNALFNWGTTYSLGLSASATPGHDPKLIDGFNIEGMAFAPDNTTMYIGFRAPLEPTTSRVNALLAPIQNFESWFGNGTTATPTFGAPVLLNLNGRGIRDIGRLAPDLYVILAGDYDDAGALPTMVYRWNGNASDAPVLNSGFNVTGLNPEGVLPIYQAGGALNYSKLQIISDNGSVVFYNDGTEAKDLANGNFKKFRSDFITSTTPLPIVFEDFQATMGSNGQVLLTWKNAVNSHTDRFVPERSLDGKTFEAVTTIAAATQTTDYRYTDNVCCAPAFFYRIKEVMTDGNVFYSNIRIVHLQDADINSIRIGYNNDRNLVTVTSNSTAAKTVQVSNLSGNVLLQTSFTGQQQSISLADFPAGMFVVNVQDGVTVKTVKIVR